jgi:hypothetical protein
MVDDVCNDDVVFYRDSLRHAKKQYSCGECERCIEPGERYRYTFIIYDGEARSEYTCFQCVVAQEWLRVHCHGWLFHGVAEDLAQHCEYGGWSVDGERQLVKVSAPARLVVGIRRRWKRFDGNGLMTPLCVTT